MKEVSAHKLIKDASIGQATRGDAINNAMARLSTQLKEAPDQISRPLQDKMRVIHANGQFIEKRTVRFNKKLEKGAAVSDQLRTLARSADEKLKEVGDVQHWAELIERDIMIVEETLRLRSRNQG